MRQQPPHGDDKPDVCQQTPNEPTRCRGWHSSAEQRQRRQGHDQRAKPLAGQHDAAEVFAQRFDGEIVRPMDAVPLLLLFGRPRLAVEDFVEQRIGGIAGEDPVLAEPQPAAKGCGQQEHDGMPPGIVMRSRDWWSRDSLRARDQSRLYDRTAIQTRQWQQHEQRGRIFRGHGPAGQIAGQGEWT